MGSGEINNMLKRNTKAIIYFFKYIYHILVNLKYGLKGLANGYKLILMFLVILVLFNIFMGLQISEIIPKREIQFSDLKGKTIAVDAFNAIYQFLTTIRQPDGTPLKDSSGNVTSHLSGLFYRNMNLILEGVRLIYVFDGEPPELKAETWRIRKEAKDLAKRKKTTPKSKKKILIRFIKLF